MTWVAPDLAAEARYQAVDDLPSSASSLSQLLDALHDESWRVRRLAADRLARLEASTELIDRLVDILGQRGQTGARNAAALALSQLGRSAVPALVRHLHHTDPDQRKFAADILGELRILDAAPALIAALEDEDGNVRASAAEALGRIGGPDAGRALEKLLDSPDPLLRVCGLEGLAQLRAPPPLPLLGRLLADPLTRRSAFRALGHLQHPAAFALIASALRSPETRDAALVALGCRLETLPADVEGDLRTVLVRVPDLLAWLAASLEGDDPEQRIGALHAVHATAEPRLAYPVAVAANQGQLAELCLQVLLRLGVPGLRELFAGAPPSVVRVSREARAVVAEAALRLAEPSLVQVFVSLLTCGDADLAELGARALGRTRAISALRPLVKLFDDDALAVHAFRSLVLLAESWPAEAEGELEAGVAGGLQPHAVRAWAQIAGPRSLAVVRRALHDEHDAVRAAAAECASHLPAEAVTMLGAALMDESARVRRGATRAVGQLEPSAAVPLLHRALADAEPSVLALACAAAAELSALEAVPQLTALAAHPEPVVVLAAVQALSLLGRLSDEVLERVASSPDAEVLKLALSLGAVRPPIVERAVQALEHPKWDVRVAAARALAVSGTAAHAPALQTALDRETDPLARELLASAAVSLGAR